ncbi:MAG: hypothetical protein ACK5W9_04895 [Bdellovibrionales bacterium]
MGLYQGFENLSTNVKTTASQSSIGAATFILRLLTGMVLGYVLGLIFQEILQTGQLVVLSFVIVMTFSFMKVSSSWSFTKVLIFDILTALVLQILRMYIMLAP